MCENFYKEGYADNKSIDKQQYWHISVRKLYNQTCLSMWWDSMTFL